MPEAATTIIDAIHQTLVVALEREGSARAALTRDGLRPMLAAIIADHPAAQTLADAERQEIIERVLNRVVGLGPLETILNNPTVTEIMINGLNSA